MEYAEGIPIKCNGGDGDCAKRLRYSCWLLTALGLDLKPPCCGSRAVTLQPRGLELSSKLVEERMQVP
jgi:hypothetical protein